MYRELLKKITESKSIFFSSLEAQCIEAIQIYIKEDCFQKYPELVFTASRTPKTNDLLSATVFESIRFRHRIHH